MYTPLKCKRAALQFRLIFDEHTQSPHIFVSPISVSLSLFLSLDFIHRSISFTNRVKQTAYRFIDNSIRTYRGVKCRFLHLYLLDVLLTMLFSIFFGHWQRWEIETMRPNLWNEIEEFAAEAKAKRVQKTTGTIRCMAKTMISNGGNILWLLILDCVTS